MTIKEQLAQSQLAVDQVIQQQLSALPETAPRLRDAMRHAALLGGKRIRPFLIYETGRMLGATSQQLAPAAAAIEYVHAYSLTHDDLPAMDNDALRRGQPTTHIVYGEAEAILAGDALQSRAFELLATDSAMVNNANIRLRMIAELAAAAGATGMCGGQSLDLQFEGQRPTRDQLEAMFNGKTGRMIIAPVILAGLSADAPDETTLAALRRFADCAGLAFQIHDDVLDIEAETATLGKPQGSDAAQNKATWPALFGLSAAKKRSRQLYQQALSELDSLTLETDSLRWLAAYLIERKY